MKTCTTLATIANPTRFATQYLASEYFAIEFFAIQYQVPQNV
jgi:hypothetical protein